MFRFPAFLFTLNVAFSDKAKKTPPLLVILTIFNSDSTFSMLHEICNPVTNEVFARKGHIQ